MTGNDDYILEILKDVGLVKPEQVEEARGQLTEDGRSVVDVLVDNGSISKLEVLKTVAMHVGMDVIVLADYDIPKEIIALVPAEIARRYKVVPVFNNEATLTVALSDPLDIETLDSLRYILKRNVEGVVAAGEEIGIALDHYYGRPELTIDQILDSGDKKSESGDGDAGDVVIGTQAEDMGDDPSANDQDAPIIKLVSLIILEAQRNRASDIHLEPMEKRFRVRYRIDGVMHEVENPPKRLQPVIISRLKLMAGMKISEKRIPQDGRIQMTIAGQELDLRVSTVPATHGESIVMRILNKQSVLLGLSSLGFFADDQQTFERLIKLSDGILLVTGPTGSGKTTTLYACLNTLNRPDLKLITVEDPVEYQLSGINQVQVREDIGLTFPAVLRSILRQAPNVIMVGEIRDFETAEIAINASLTGHLVFSTLHTNDAPSAITRLLDIGIKPFLLASSIRATMGQRLVRIICEKCKETYPPTEQEIAELGLAPENIAQTRLYRGRGCQNCANTGYRGRKGIFEMFVINDTVRNMIYQKLSATELRVRARELGMRTLREDGVRKVIAGITTLSEVVSATMED